jgi:hypothetical protein
MMKYFASFNADAMVGLEASRYSVSLAMGITGIAVPSLSGLGLFVSEPA